MSGIGRPAGALALLLCGLLSALPGCRSNEDDARLLTQKINSKHFYDAGDFVRAEEVCRKGLEIDSSDATLQLTLAYSLMMQGEEKQLAEARAILEEREGWWGTSDWRVNLGLGVSEQQLARAAERKDKASQAADLRASARGYLNKALEQSSKEQNTPAELYYHLCLLDLDDARNEEFLTHADAAIVIMQRNDKVFAAELGKPMSDKDKERTEHDRTINRTRARDLLREKGRLQFEAGNLAGAGQSMKLIADFGELTAGDYFSRGRIREKLGDLDGAVSDFEHYLSKTENSVDDHVTKAVESLTRLRAKLAERRTAPHAAGQ